MNFRLFFWWIVVKLEDFANWVKRGIEGLIEVVHYGKECELCRRRMGWFEPPYKIVVRNGESPEDKFTMNLCGGCGEDFAKMEHEAHVRYSKRFATKGRRIPATEG